MKVHNKYLFFLILLLIGCSLDKPIISDKKHHVESIITEPIDSVLKVKLELIGVEDQTLRLLLPNIQEKFGIDSPEEKYIWSVIIRQDSICLNKTIEIMDEHGWLGKSRVGENANQVLWLVIQHADLEIQEKYLPMLEKSVNLGESEGWHQAFLEDRILMRNEQNQIYGSQPYWDKSINALKIYPIDDVKNVNKRRKLIGLEPIEEYAQMNGYIFDQKD